MELRIKELLKEKGKTTVWLAGELGIAQPSASNIVNNRVSPSLDTLDKISQILSVPITELFQSPQENTVNCPNCGAELQLKKKDTI